MTHTPHDPTPHDPTPTGPTPTNPAGPTPPPSPVGTGVDPLAGRLHVPRPPRLILDLAAVSARYRAVLDTITTTEMRAALLVSVVDVPPLVTEVDRLWGLLVRCRLRNANLTAAARAALSAARDGDLDPWAYLRDELGMSAVAGGSGRGRQ